MAATVGDLIAIWNIKAGGYRDSLPNGDTDKIVLLNAAKHMIWASMVAAGRPPKGNGNWFAKSAQIAFTASDREKDLPSDFHDVLFVEPVTATWEEVNFEAQDFYKDVFRQNRRSATAVTPADGTRFYVIAGDNPAKIIIDRKCTGGVTLQVWYTSVLPEWTASGDSVTRLPTPYQDAVVNLAALMNAASRQDPNITQLWKMLYEDNKALIAIVGSLRQNASIVSPQTYDNVG